MRFVFWKMLCTWKDEVRASIERQQVNFGCVEIQSECALQVFICTASHYNTNITDSKSEEKRLDTDSVWCQ